jgi:MFS family permease
VVTAGLLLLAAMAAEPFLAALAHQGLTASSGSLPVWISAAFGVVGLIVAGRRPRNRLGWIMIAVAGFSALAEDASFYAVADYRLHAGGLPLGWVAMLAQPGWAPSIVLLGLLVLLFPDGRLPSARWRWLLWPYLGVAALWIAGAIVLTIGAIAGHRIGVDTGGNLLIIDHPTGGWRWWSWINAMFFPLLAVGWLLSLTGQVLSYRRASGERRQQLKWLLTGSVIGGAGLMLSLTPTPGESVSSLLVSVVGSAAFLAIPVSMGVAILRYRLYDIDRIISRTLAYALVTGLLVGLYAGLVLLATQVLQLSSPVSVAAATLLAAALFNPLRRRVQRLADRRFNRARYDADRTVAAFAARLTSAIDVDATRAELVQVVQAVLEPAHVSVWIRPGG